ncbi:pirin [Lysobacteraceae bacterium NML120232]|nr:pirin [Xanthomonadaceae bacterium NML120232]
MTTLPSRHIASTNAPQTLHHDAIREGRAAVMPGLWERHDPFLSMMNDRFKPGAFGPHPHRGFETVTYVISGDLAHEDSKGSSGVLHPGDVQWMTAGRGVVHNESPVNDSGVHVLQLWVNLPAKHKLTDFRYQDLRAESVPVHTQEGVRVKVFAGESAGVQGAAQTFSPITFLEITLEAGRSFTHPIAPDDNGFIYVLQGQGRFGADGARGAQDDTLWLEHLTEASQITLHADTDLKVLLLTGQPLREPVAAYGPFVMNTREQLMQAVLDYQSGEFGQIAA